MSIARIGAPELAAAEVDGAVRAALERGEELYAVDEAVLQAVRPDVIVTQTLCTVCAVSGDGVRRATRAVGVDAEIVELEPTTVEGVLRAIVALGDRLGVGTRARELVPGAAGAPRPRGRGGRRDGRAPTVFVAEWVDPPFAAGHWVPELVELAGGREVLGQAGAPSFTTDWDAVRAAAPDVCVIAPCGYDAARARCGGRCLAGRDVRAARGRRRRQRLPVAARPAHRRRRRAARRDPASRRACRPSRSPTRGVP